MFDGSEDGLGQCRILVVEDDPVISLHLETIITQTTEAEVVLAQSIAEAEATLALQLDYAFLDVDVLDGTTYAFAATLQARTIPFAFLSASDRERMPPALRAMPFVAKPYTPLDVIRLLHDAGKCEL